MTTLSEQALAILDQKGEFALIAFMAKHANPEQPSEEWPQKGQCLMQDHSRISHDEDGYRFTFFSQDSKQYATIERPTSMQPEQRPTLEPEFRPVPDWPNHRTIYNEVVENLEADLEILQDHHIIDPATSHTLAPALHDAINQSIDELQMTEMDELPNAHDAIEICANRAQYILGENQVKAIKAAMVLAHNLEHPDIQ